MRWLLLAGLILVSLSVVSYRGTATVESALGADRTYSVLAYGARCDGTTNDTTAIQNALNAAKNVAPAVVTIPASTCMFSNLTIAPFVSLIGKGMNVSVLKRRPESTGPAITETSAGATAIRIEKLAVHGNGTSGDGIVLGYAAPGLQLNYLGHLDDVLVRDFPSGTGIRVQANAVRIGHIWANANRVGVEVGPGAGTSLFEAIWAEGNARQQVILGGWSDTVQFLHAEAHGDANYPVVELRGNQANLGTVVVTNQAALGVVVLVKAGADRVRVTDMAMVSAPVHTYLIWHEVWARGVSEWMAGPYVVTAAGVQGGAEFDLATGTTYPWK